MAKLKTTALPSRLSMTETAKLLGTGRNKLVKFLREHELLLPNRKPAPKWLENGVFAYKESTRDEVTDYVPLVKREGFPILKAFYESKMKEGD